MIDYANIPGIDAPLGSVESRAAARLIAQLKLEQGSCGCAYWAGVIDNKLWISNGPFHICEAHDAGADANPKWKLSKEDIARDRLLIERDLAGVDLTSKFVSVKRPI